MVEKKRHKWADIIHAWAEGEVIEKLDTLSCDPQHGNWKKIDAPMFFEDRLYRIKPDSKIEVKKDELYYDPESNNWSEK